jgi:hypothetical protein
MIFLIKEIIPKAQILFIAIHNLYINKHRSEAADFTSFVHPQ